MDNQTASPRTSPATKGADSPSRWIILFYLACLVALCFPLAFGFARLLEQVGWTVTISSITTSVALTIVEDDAQLAEIIPYAAAFMIATTVPLRNRSFPFWLSVFTLITLVASYQILIWQLGEGRWILNVLEDSGLAADREPLEKFFTVMRNGSGLALASLVGLSVNGDTKA